MNEKRCLKNCNKLFYSIFMVFILVFSGLEVHAISKPLIIIGIPEVPLRFYDENRTPRGIDVEIIAHILNKLNVDYKILLIKSSARLKAKWEATTSEYDMVFTYSYKDHRTKHLIYPKESHIHITQSFFILKKNDGKIVFNTYKDLKGFKIGAIQGFSYTKEFWNKVKTENLKLDLHPLRELQIKKLLAGRIDLAAVPKIVTLYEAKQDGYSDKIMYLPKPIKSKPYYNTFIKVSKHPRIKEVIEMYDEELRKMKRDGTLKAIFDKYGIGTEKW